MMAMSLTFLAISFLMGAFLTTLRRSGQSRHTTMAATAAQSKLELLSAIAMESLAPVANGQFQMGNEKFVYQVEISDAGDYDADGLVDHDLKVLKVTMTAPSGATSTMSRLRVSNPPYYGVACGSGPDGAFFGSADPCWNSYPVGAKDNGAGNEPDFNASSGYFLYNPGSVPTPDLPNRGRVGAVACDSACKKFYVIDYINGGLRSISEGAATWSAVQRPAGLGRASGLCCDATGSKVFVADETNRCLWRFNGASWSGPYSPTAPAAGRLLGLACDSAGDKVWAVDSQKGCLRRFDAVTNSWDPTQYSDPNLGVPTGVAVRGDGKQVFVMDGGQLFWFDPATPSAPWSTTHLLSKLASDVPSGLACNPAGTVVWAVPIWGPLARYDLGNDSWDEFYPPGVSY
jgi:hypothetical protein